MGCMSEGMSCAGMHCNIDLHLQCDLIMAPPYLVDEGSIQGRRHRGSTDVVAWLRPVSNMKYVSIAAQALAMWTWHTRHFEQQ